MSELWLDANVTLAAVPANIFPLIDDADFKTRKTAIVFNSPCLVLAWNFVSASGAMTQTSLSPASAGNYLWANKGAGMYSIQVPSSGGNTINNDAAGFGWFSGFASGVLPWRSPLIGFRAAALNNSLVEGATIDVNVTAMAANTLTASALAADAVDEILDDVVEGTLTLRQIVRIMLSALAGKTTGGGLNFRNNADTGNRIIATVDVSNNRTAITLDGT